MRFLICTMNYSPEVTGIGRYSGEMAEWLEKRGHSVTVICSQPYYPDWRVFDGYSSWRYNKEKNNNVKVIRCPLWVPQKPSGLKRILHLLSYALSSSFVTLIESFRKPDVIITIEPPLFTAPISLLGAKLSGAKSVIHIQDFEVEAAVVTGLVQQKHIVRIALSVEKYLLTKFSYVSTISKNMVKKLVSKGVSENKIGLIPNWVNTNVIVPVASPSKYRDTLKLSNETFVVLYSGNIGRKQGLEIIFDIAQQLKEKVNIKFVVAGGGVGKSDFFNTAARFENIICIPLQPEEMLCELLNLADVHLLPMLQGTDDLVMPSKLGNMLASGKPVIVTADMNSEIAEFINGAGFVVPFGDYKKVSSCIEVLAEDYELAITMGKQARDTAISNLDKEVVLGNAEMMYCNS
jgi:colanic acid biosynthesis glycosyl transferase WcaI